MEREEWRDIEGFEDIYQCSNLGNIRSCDRCIIRKDGIKQVRKGKVVKPTISNSGYKVVHLYKGNKRSEKYVHRIIAITFLKNKNNEKIAVNHKDGDKSNNRAANLEWVTNSENVIHAFQTINRKPVDVKPHHITIKVTDTENNNEIVFPSISEAARSIDLSATQITRYIRNETKTKLWRDRYLIQPIKYKLKKLNRNNKEIWKIKNTNK